MLGLTQKGTSLIEVIFATAALTIISYGVLTSLDHFSNQVVYSKSVQARDKQLAALVETLRANSGLYQISYDANATTIAGLLDPLNTSSVLHPSNLPLAWNMNKIDTVIGCPSCPGRLGYVIYPMQGFPGLFKMVIRVKNEVLFKGHLDYEFIVSQNR